MNGLGWGRLTAAAMAVALVGAAAPRLDAQDYFGQNQVQYDRFNWRVLETEHFLVHYYPEEHAAAVDAARMAERSYARLSRVLDHQFREKKPIILFASRTDFAQNNVTGDLGEGTGGVTDLGRQRNMLPFTGDYRSFEHVLTHEMVHQFQYDIFARGKAGNGIQQFSQVDPPLWFMEGMAEYLSLGPDYPNTDATMRDAALNGNVPSVEDMTQRPDKFFPYSFGEAFWAYVGQRFGDESIGRIMEATTTQGVERAFKRETGLSLEDLGDEWRESVQTQFLPQIGSLDRARRLAQPLLTEKRSGGELFVAPALSNDGRYIAFISTGSFLRGEVFPDLWLADARTGKRIKRLVKSTLDPNFEELRLLYSQSSFSPDGRFLVFTAQRSGKDVLYLLDVRRRKTVARLDLGLEYAVNPTWSPDSKRLVFSGGGGGLTDLYMVDVDGKNLKQLTNDKYGDLQPQWSPDGRTIAFASDRGPGTNFDLLKFNKWEISLYDVASGTIETIPNQGGLNLNPMWSPDGKSIAYISDRAGTPNIFLYDFDTRDHYQLTNLVGSVGAFTEYSPALTWARGADRLAFTYYENNDYTVWSVDNPRLLRKAPYRGGGAPPTIAQTLALMAGRDTAALRPAAIPSSGAAVIAARPDTTLRSIPATAATPTSVVGTSTGRSFYRAPTGARASDSLPASSFRDSSVVSIAALLDSAALALPDTTQFKDYVYHRGFQPDYIARPSVGYAQDNFGRGVFGGTTIVLSDLLGNSRLAFSGAVNGRVSEAQVYVGYTSLGRRLQYQTNIQQVPYYFLAGQEFLGPDQDGISVQRQALERYIIRQVGGAALYPLNRFTRFEFGASFSNIDRLEYVIDRQIAGNTPITDFYLSDQRNLSSFNYAAPYIAYVSDNTLTGYTGPIYGRRFRFQIEPTVGSFRWINYSADYRRYDAILFNFLTVATRAMTSIQVGRDEAQFPRYIGNPQFIRGYDRQNFSYGCGVTAGTGSNFGCNATQLLGSRVALANAELRFPLIRRFDLGLLPISLPPLDGLVFYDAGTAWYGGQTVHFVRPGPGSNANDRYLLTSYGAGLRLNLFGFAIVRWDYAIPLDTPGHKGFWTWSVGPSF